MTLFPLPGEQFHAQTVRYHGWFLFVLSGSCRAAPRSLTHPCCAPLHPLPWFGPPVPVPAAGGCPQAGTAGTASLSCSHGCPQALPDSCHCDTHPHGLPLPSPWWLGGVAAMSCSQCSFLTLNESWLGCRFWTWFIVSSVGAELGPLGCGAGTGQSSAKQGRTVPDQLLTLGLVLGSRSAYLGLGCAGSRCECRVTGGRCPLPLFPTPSRLSPVAQPLTSGFHFTSQEKKQTKTGL